MMSKMNYMELWVGVFCMNEYEEIDLGREFSFS